MFALMGDMPYSQPHANLMDGLIDRVNAAAPAFVVHVGDITSGRGPCHDEWLEARKRQFGRFQAPFVLLPGDNEWLDCRRRGEDPMERLGRWRSLFCVPVALEGFARQGGPHCENVRWTAANLVFVGVNVPGGFNNARDPREQAARMRAVSAWLDEAEALAKDKDGLVVIMHANPFVTRAFGADGYAAVRARLVRLGRERAGKVMLVHGDTHHYRDDEPLPGLRRVEVFGWPHLGWAKVTLEHGPGRPVHVEPMRE